MSSKSESTNVPWSQIRNILLKKLTQQKNFWCFPLPCDCENGPEEPVNLRKRSGEDVADAVHGGHLGVLVQSLHQGAPFCHVVLGQFLGDN